MILPENYTDPKTLYSHFHSGICKYAIHYQNNMYWAVCPNTGMTSTPYRNIDNLEQALKSANIKIDWME